MISVLELPEHLREEVHKQAIILLLFPHKSTAKKQVKALKKHLPAVKAIFKDIYVNVNKDLYAKFFQDELAQFLWAKYSKSGQMSKYLKTLKLKNKEHYELLMQDSELFIWF